MSCWLKKKSWGSDLSATAVTVYSQCRQSFRHTTTRLLVLAKHQIHHHDQFRRLNFEMPSVLGHAETNGTVPETNGQHRPETPAGRMALTDYSINPSPSSEEKRARLLQSVPEDLLLPNGYPDVCFS
jgi:hypothetical protein